MAFFDNIGKKLSNTGKNISQQARRYTESVRLDNMVREKNARIETLYTQIGRAYHEAHRDDDQAEQLELVREINGIYAEIDDCMEQKRKLDYLACPKCGAEVHCKSEFCPQCGARVNAEDEPVPDSRPLCPVCRAPLPEDALFCAACGTKLDTLPVQDQPEEDTSHCPQCGAAIDEGDAFCIACGAKLGGEVDTGG